MQTSHLSPSTTTTIWDAPVHTPPAPPPAVLGGHTDCPWTDFFKSTCVLLNTPGQFFLSYMGFSESEDNPILPKHPNSLHSSPLLPKEGIASYIEHEDLRPQGPPLSIVISFLASCFLDDRGGRGPPPAKTGNMIRHIFPQLCPLHEAGDPL